MKTYSSLSCDEMALGDEGHHGAGYLCHERQRRHWRIDNDISHLRRYLISHTASLVTVARGFAFGRMPRENKSLSCRRQAVAFVRSFVRSFIHSRQFQERTMSRMSTQRRWRQSQCGQLLGISEFLSCASCHSIFR